MPLPKETAWFPAKKYGFGWGVPRRWQGVFVLLGYVGTLIAGTRLIGKGPAYYLGFVIVASVLLFLTCWWKGERPRWRWGEDER
ncbi:MAG: hypothetical protein JWM32_971 [Verrucomicrobia bacterium]|nr:hypothetical protein [Verrucomicrobiota bacterium]